MISLLHPSRGRAKQAIDAAAIWLQNAGLHVEYILSIDNDDAENDRYLRYFSQNQIIDQKGRRMIENKNRSAVDAINNAAKVAKGDILIVMSDDFECKRNWAERIIKAIGDKNDFVAKTPDGIQKWIITMPIMDRTYYNRFGYIYHPDYLHLFCDTELTCVADLTARKIELDIPFIHNHYSTGKSVKDSVSERADKTWSQGEKLFIERYKRNFDLINPPGKITSPEYLNWIKGKL